MYERVSKEDLRRVGKIGYISLGELSSGHYERSVSIRSYNAPSISKELFRFNSDLLKNRMLITDFDDVRFIAHPREYEEFSMVTIKHFIRLAKSINVTKLEVSSKDARILETFYEMGFKSIIISETNTGSRVYSATKELY